MTNPTTPFNWQMPTSTDLVTDLPADFETFGQAVATSMADLLGGTTGQVLSKASNTDMDFTWVAQDDSNAIQNAIVDAKGDLIAASAADTPARLAVGTNGQYLQADSTAATGLKWATLSTSPTFVGATAFANGQTVSFTGGTRAVIPYNNESFDTNGFHSTSSNTGRMTIPTGYAGKYLIAAWAEAASNYAVRSYVYGTFAKNGSSISGTARGNSFSNLSDGFFNPTLTTIIDLAVGDYVDFGIALGATYTETGGIYGAFSIQWLGA